MESKNIWICEKEEIKIKAPIFTVLNKHCRSSENENQKHQFYVFESNDWCNIIPITREGNIVLVKQFRVGINDHTIEVPGGVIDNDDPDITSAALREMSEETGYQISTDTKTTYLGWSYANPAIQNNRCHMLITGPVEKTGEQNLDSGEMIEVLEVSPRELWTMIQDHRYRHSLAINNLFFMWFLEAQSAIEFEKMAKNYVNSR